MLQYASSIIFCFAVIIALTSPSCAQTTPLTSNDQASLTKILGFEDQPGADKPQGWSGNPPGTVTIDDKIVHSGQRSVRLERNAQSAGEFSVLGRTIPWEFSGKVIEIRGFLRTENVSGFAGFWMRQDKRSEMLSLENMERQQLNGTHDWAEYKITLPIHPETEALVFGVIWRAPEKRGPTTYKSSSTANLFGSYQKRQKLQRR